MKVEGRLTYNVDTKCYDICSDGVCLCEGLCSGTLLEALLGDEWIPLYMELWSDQDGFNHVFFFLNLANIDFILKIDLEGLIVRIDVFPPSCDFISNEIWLSSFAADQDLILCKVSALEFLGLFSGYSGDEKIEVYSKEKGKYQNVVYNVVNTFADIDCIKIRGALCTSVSQTINDMLNGGDVDDELALTEGLGRYYLRNGSFDDISIFPENLETFQIYKERAIEYFRY